MAMLAQKSSFSASLGMGPPQMASAREYTIASSSHRTPVVPGNGHNGTFASPTESEFSEAYDAVDSVRAWDENRVGEWLRTIGCGQYEQAFKSNNVSGSNLIECDQSVLKEMGIKKIGDRVRIFVAIKGLRNHAVGNQKKRNRDSIMALDNRTTYTPTSIDSMRNLNSARNPSQTSISSKRQSRVDFSGLENFHTNNISGARPSSPLAGSEVRARAHRYGNMSPMDHSRKESLSQGYFTSSNPNSANTVSGRRPETPSNIVKTGNPTRSNTTADSTMGKLPGGVPVIRVIYNGGQTKVLEIKGCKTAQDIILTTLRKLNLPENHVPNYCFYVIDGAEREENACRRLTDSELVRICADHHGVARGRLILRKIHAGEPDLEEIRKASGIYSEELVDNYSSAIGHNNAQSQLKIARLTGEPWDAVKFPLSPATFSVTPRVATAPAERSRSNTVTSNSEAPLPRRTSSRRAPKPLKQFLGARPPSELISQELSTYFPDHKADEIERAVTLSQQRASRLSRIIQNRMSTASTSSFSPSIADAPPLPNIADNWLNGTSSVVAVRGPRPLSVTRYPTSFRDSIISTALQPLPEESPTEPNRKSYVSFDSASDMANVSITDPDGQTRQSYYDDSGSSGLGTDAGGSLKEQYRSALAEDGEGPDEELDKFLGGDSWDNVKWMQGSLIGQGSFGSVFLALHAITGELMAVKQVEMPSKTNSDIDRRKQVMVAALKREIDLLRDLQHPHIVQYLGSNCDDEHFNIFLEYVPGGSVAAMLNNYGQLKEPLIRNFVRQILDGLSYLHGKDIIHRDIKGANVLVDNKGTIKISDFGISKRVEASALLHPAKGGHVNRPSLQGSVFWMAPEVVKQTSYTRKADIWSLGCLIVEMFTGTHPFPNCSQLQAIFQIGGSGAKPTTPENASDEGKTFLTRTFEIDHEKRPSADELLQSPFLKQIA